MSAVQRLLSAARSTVGTAERPVNVVSFNDAFYGRRVSGSAYPWCQAWCWWVGVRCALAAILPPKTAATTVAAAWYARRGQFSRTPHVGDQVFYDWGSGIAHTGFVEAVLPGGRFVALEGNTGAPGRSQANGGEVRRQVRSAASIGRRGGFGHPDYAGVDRGAVRVAAAATASVDHPVGGALRPDVLPVLGQGARSGWVSLAQRCLRVGVDGAFGPGTAAAVRAQQARYGLAADGVIGAWTWVSFVADAGPSLAPGAHGHPGIEVLQNLVGLRGAELDADFGRATAARVRGVQRWAGLVGDAVVGPATRAALARG